MASAANHASMTHAPRVSLAERAVAEPAHQSEFREDTTQHAGTRLSGKRSFSVVSMQPNAEPAPPITNLRRPRRGARFGSRSSVVGGLRQQDYLIRMRYHLEANRRELRSRPHAGPSSCCRRHAAKRQTADPSARV